MPSVSNPTAGRDQAGEPAFTLLTEDRRDLRAGRLEAEAENIRGLIGKLDVPSYEEWKAADEKYDAEQRAEYEAELDREFPGTKHRVIRETGDTEVPF